MDVYLLLISGLTCKSIVNVTETDKAAPYYRYTDGACVGILNAPKSFDCTATTTAGAKVCPCEAVERMCYGLFTPCYELRVINDVLYALQ